VLMHIHTQTQKNVWDFLIDLSKSTSTFDN
jgi:hypothetical protein